MVPMPVPEGAHSVTLEVSWSMLKHSYPERQSLFPVQSSRQMPSPDVASMKLQWLPAAHPSVAVQPLMAQ